jgi:hypothetical protein
MPGKPFYTELAEELIKEDYSPDSPTLQKKALAALKVPDEKPKTVKSVSSPKSVLIEGIQSLNSIALVLKDIGGKFDENDTILANRKVGFWGKVRKLMDQVLKIEPEPTVYEVDYTDSATGISFRETVVYEEFRAEIDKNMRNLSALGSRASAEKFEAQDDEKLIAYLEGSIKQIQAFLISLMALDDFFKTHVGTEDRDRVKGIKPELSTIRNALYKANDKRADYTGAKEEVEQFKKLGIDLAG